MLRYFSTKEGGEKKKKKVTKKRKVVDDDDVDVENSTTPDHNANKKIKTITAKKKKRKPAQGHKVATQSQVDKIIKDTKQLQAKNLRFDHTKAFNGDVEPISEPQEMFDDMVRRANESAAIKDKEGVTKFLNHVGDRPIRVATMCSGTESPVLALKMIAKAAKDQGLGDLRIEHVFSAEIEPYKQAYISRNFGDHDLILFRDVEELQFTHAHTAYGARVEVPLDVDLLIAGTSCKDCSSLNNQRQDLLDKNAQGTGGESYRTFFGMFSWVKRARPAFVILENVSGAPWDDMCATFESINYHATWRKVDTKMWYVVIFFLLSCLSLSLSNPIHFDLHTHILTHTHTHTGTFRTQENEDISLQSIGIILKRRKEIEPRFGINSWEVYKVWDFNDVHPLLSRSSFWTVIRTRCFRFVQITNFTSQLARLDGTDVSHVTRNVDLLRDWAMHVRSRDGILTVSRNRFVIGGDHG